MNRFRWWAVLFVSSCAALSACRASSAPNRPSAADDEAITVGSFNFPESQVLAEIYAQALEGHGLPVERQPNLGPRELVEPALERGLIDVVPEYAGSTLEFLGRTPTSDEDLTHQLLVDALTERGLTALDPAPASDHNAFAMLASTAEQLGIRRLSDVRPYAADMAFGGPSECEARYLCLGGLQDQYGLRFKEFVPLDTGGPLTVQALLGGTIEMGLLFSSDPALGSGDLIELRDDLRLQPAENVTPLVSRAALDRYGPGLSATLNAVSAALTTADLRAMNAALSSGRSPYAVARGWLAAHGFPVPSG